MNTQFTWGNKQDTAFHILKNKLGETPVLIYPDFEKPFILTTDASKYDIKKILSQGEIISDKPIAYGSRLLNTHEKNYITYDKEALAIVFSINHFRPYLYGNKFTVVTDHKPLCWMREARDPTSRINRWRLRLSEYEFKVVYKAGKYNINADALSWNPVDRDKNIYEIKVNIKNTSPPPKVGLR